MSRVRKRQARRDRSERGKTFSDLARFRVWGLGFRV